MFSFRKLFAIALMSVLASGVNAQTSTTKIEATDSVKIMAALPTAQLTEEDKEMVRSLLRWGSLEGGIAEDGGIISFSKYGDSWVAYISCREGEYYLTYEVTSPDGKPRGTAYIKIG